LGTSLRGSGEGCYTPADESSGSARCRRHRPGLLSGAVDRPVTTPLGSARQWDPTDDWHRAVKDLFSTPGSRA